MSIAKNNQKKTSTKNQYTKTRIKRRKEKANEFGQELEFIITEVDVGWQGNDGERRGGRTSISKMERTVFSEKP